MNLNIATAGLSSSPLIVRGIAWRVLPLRTAAVLASSAALALFDRGARRRLVFFVVVAMWLSNV
jgi:hypothetical protein